ncbi:MAG: hypothetical protein FNP40_05860 [Dehalobacter sp. 4CP]|nr:hypothetical protein [Dehalobacter sp. 4CP]
MASEVYQASPIKRKRRTKQELQTILDATRAILAEEEGAITIRHLFYRLVSQKLLAKEEREYDKLISYLMKWRRSGEIHWSAFADNTRYYYGTRGYLSMNDALQDLMDSYKRNLWASQDAFVEIWCEKDAIVSIISSIASQFGVRTFPLHGFSSATALYGAAEMFKDARRAGKQVYIYYFGDYDPSGVHIDRSAIKNLKKDHGVEPIFQRVAITPEQIERYGLTTRPSKKTDSRSKNFKGESVEIDAMPMGVLRSMVEECITQHIDPTIWHRELAIERSEKMGLSDLICRGRC